MLARLSISLGELVGRDVVVLGGGVGDIVIGTDVAGAFVTNGREVADINGLLGFIDTGGL